MDLLEEKRDIILRNVYKRQRKAAIASFVKQSDAGGKPTMTSYVSRQALAAGGTGDHLELPNIQPSNIERVR